MVNRYPNYTIINVDALTYAADKGRLQQIEAAENYHFEEVDISDPKEVQGVFSSYQVDAVIHLAAESHVDRSIENPLAFAETNILGTMQLLEACRSSWKKGSDHLFYHVSTDEVYGSLDKKGVFDLKSAYNPRSPYACIKSKVQIIWCVPMAQPTDCHTLSPIAAIIMAQTNTKRNSFQPYSHI
jgi:dTDP-glucose 4,6-dehydratase